MQVSVLIEMLHLMFKDVIRLRKTFFNSQFLRFKNIILFKQVNNMKLLSFWHCYGTIYVKIDQIVLLTVTCLTKILNNILLLT